MLTLKPKDIILSLNLPNICIHILNFFNRFVNTLNRGYNLTNDNRSNL